ncbi:hypothetical protein ACSSS7_003186 [Eimeria intestinalis]
MAVLSTGGLKANVGQAGHLDYEASPGLSLRGRAHQEKTYGGAHWPSQGAGRSGLIKCLLIASVVSLTLVYMLLSCFHYVAYVPRVSTASRSLAIGGSDGGLCPERPEGGGSAGTLGDEEEIGGGAPPAGSLQGSRGAEVPSGQQSAPRSALQSPESGWGPRLPLRWLGIVRGLILSTKQLATTYMELFPVLGPLQAVELCEQVAMLAVIELCGLAYIPGILQPLRAEAAHSFASVVSVIMSHKATAQVVQETRLMNRLERLKSLLDKLGGTPPSAEISPNYMEVMQAWVSAATFSVTQSLAELESLLHPQERRRPGSQATRRCLKVVRAIYLTRKVHLLRNRTMRRWLVYCHSDVAASLIYTRRELNEFPRNYEHQQEGLLEQLHHAVLAAGGALVQSTTTSSRLEPEPASHHSALPPLRDTGGSGLHPEDVQQQHFPELPEVHLPVPPPAHFGPVELPQKPFGARQPRIPPQPQPQAQTHLPQLSPVAPPAESPRAAPSSQGPHQPHSAPLHWEQFGARPRQPVPPAEHVRAEDLGWGYRQMPPEWSARIRELLELTQKAAAACGSLLRSLSPIQGVLVPMHLSMLAAVGIAAVAYIPDDLQPLRKAVGDSYRQLLERVLTTEPTQSAAARKGLTTRIMCLQVALERLSGVPSEIAIEADDYARKTCIRYRLWRYVFLQTLSLFEGLMPLQQPSAGRRVDAVSAVKAIRAMVCSMKMNLLVDTQMRRWFVSQAGNLQYPLYSREDLDKASPRAVMTTSSVVLRLQKLLVRANVVPIPLEKGLSPFRKDPQSSSGAAGEQSSSGLRDPSSQDPRELQPEPLRPRDLGLSLEPERELSRPRVTSAVSPQALAQPALPGWPVVPSPFSGFPHTSMWTWSLRDQQQAQQRRAQDYLGSTYFFSSGVSSGPAASGVPGSRGGERHQGSSGRAGGDLGLLDLAARVSQWDVFGEEEGEEDRG